MVGFASVSVSPVPSIGISAFVIGEVIIDLRARGLLLFFVTVGEVLAGRADLPAIDEKTGFRNSSGQ